MKFRIKKVPILGWFSQVKRHWYTPWERIGIEFDLYDEDSDKYPKSSREEAIDYIDQYKKFINRTSTYEIIIS